MERRVVKFSLVGAIFFVILVIACIVAIVWAAISLSSGGGNKENDNKQKQEQEQEPPRPPEPAEQEVKDTITDANGEKQEVVINTHESDKLTYSLSYVPEFLEVKKESDTKETIKSTETEEVTIEIEKFADGFIDKSRELITTEATKRKEDSSYSMDAIDLNGRLCYIEKRIKDEDVYMEYTIEYEKSYYHINVHIGKDYVQKYQSVIEKMLRGFRVM